MGWKRLVDFPGGFLRRCQCRRQAVPALRADAGDHALRSNDFDPVPVVHLRQRGVQPIAAENDPQPNVAEKPRQALARPGKVGPSFIPLVLPFCFQQAMVGGQGHSLMPEREAVIIMDAGREASLCFNHLVVLPFERCRRQECRRP